MHRRFWRIPGNVDLWSLPRALVAVNVVLAAMEGQKWAIAGSQAWIAAIRGRMPMMFMTRVML